MAIVLDQFDPSGMFSKAGRVSLEMFQIIQQKNEILFNKKKSYHPKMTSFGLYDMDSLKQKSNSIEEFKEKKANLDLKKTLSKISSKAKPSNKREPFTKIVSRDQINQIYSKEKLNDKRFGMYHPRYNLVFKKKNRKSPLYFYENKDENASKKKKREKTERRHSLTKGKQHLSTSPNTSQSLDLQTLPDLPIKPSRKIVNPIPLEKQLPRKEIFISSLNERRFDYLELPEISTKVKRAININLKYGGRTNYNSVFASERSGLEYKPKYSLVFPKDDLMIPNFKKTVARKLNNQITYTLNETSLTYDEYNTEDFSPTGKKIVGPIFEKMMSREMSTNESKLSLKENSKNVSEMRIKDQNSSRIKKAKGGKGGKFPLILNSNR